MSTISTYWMNLLQSVPEDKFGPVLVTLNPPFEPKKELVVGEWEYEHPLFTERVSDDPHLSDCPSNWSDELFQIAERQMPGVAPDDPEQAGALLQRGLVSLRLRTCSLSPFYLATQPTAPLSVIDTFLLRSSSTRTVFRPASAPPSRSGPRRPSPRATPSARSRTRSRTASSTSSSSSPSSTGACLSGRSTGSSRCSCWPHVWSRWS